MDAEKFAAEEDYTRLLAMRAEVERKAASHISALRQRAALLAGGNRAQRHKALSTSKKIDRFEQWITERIDQEFKKLTDGYDPAAGTLDCVQQEAARKLAEIFD